MGAFKQYMTSLAANMALRLAKGHRLTVVTYHRVGGKHLLQESHIRDHLEYIARHFEVVTSAQALRASHHHKMAMITIDDSHRDIYEHIFPVALSLKIPIIICVPTDYFLRNRWLWFDQIAWMQEQSLTGKEVVIGGQRYDFGAPESVALLKKHLKRLQPPERSSMIDELAQRMGLTMPQAPTDGYEAVAQAEMREMLATGLVELCAHTVTHTIATVLPESQLRHELTQCKSELEEFCGKEVACFCYPNGEIGDFNESTKQALKDAGFRMALTSDVGNNDMRETDPFYIRRVHAHHDFSVMMKRVSGFGSMRTRSANTGLQQYQ